MTPQNNGRLNQELLDLLSATARPSGPPTPKTVSAAETGDARATDVIPPILLAA